MIPSDRATVVLVVDVSGSMQATDIKPTRLAAAQAAVRRFLDKVPSRVRVALIAFAGDPQVAAPPTTDREVIREGLNSLSFFSGYGGTAIGDALAAAVELVKPPSPRRRADDRLHHGREHAEEPGLDPLPLRRPPDAGPARAARGRRAREGRGDSRVHDRARDAERSPHQAARRVRRRVRRRRRRRRLQRPQIPVPPDPATLRQIAQTTGGKFFDARSAKAVESAYSHLGSVVARVHGKKEATNEFLGLAAILLVAAGAFSALVAPRLP